jgi:hypothetical protein
MKPISLKLLPVLFGVILTLAPQGVRAAAIHSINDLPRSWSGVAGDLFSRGTALLNLGQALERSRKVTGTFTQVDYEVQGTLELAGRNFTIKGAQLMIYAGYEKRAEIIWRLTDALVPNLFTVARYDEESKTFQLFESGDGRRGERRFALQAAALN